MQSRVLKIVVGVVILFLGSFHALNAQVSGYRLKQADSLYLDKKYTESLEHYQTILSQNQYTPAMLLKMAYIQEGLNHVGEALYYLNLYYLASHDKSVVEKMEELATRYNLEGYENSDADQALSFYRDYHFHITLVLAVLALFFVALAYSIKRKGKRPIASGIFTALVLLLLFYHVNMGGKISLGIVGSSHTFLMEGPSSGAPVIEIVDEGHRVEIIGKNDVWVEVLWNGEVAYIKEGNLLPVRL
jgi:lipopolysaccharide export LptBFGC system permease protein LptF